MNALDADAARLIVDSAADFVAGHAAAAKARQRSRAGGRDDVCWHGMAALGWFGIGVPEAAGGLGLDAHAACLVAEQAGRGLLTPPLTMTMAVASFLAAVDDADVASLLAGRSSALMASARHPIAPDGSVAIEFLADVAADGDLASRLIVGVGEGRGFEVRSLGLGIEGVHVDSASCVDGSVMATLRIDADAWRDARRIAIGDAAQDAWRRAVDLHRLTDAAWLCGLMESVSTMSLDYLRLRRQFGVAIGSFQALQHRAVDCHVQRSATRALVYEAARAALTPRAGWAARVAIRQATRAALHLAKENVQFHGAIGFADEHDAGLYLRRAMVLAARHAGV